MKTWDVVLLTFPFNDGSGQKLRPAVVVSKDLYHTTCQDGIFLLITSNVARAAYYDVVVLETHPEFRQTGLRTSSAIRVDKINNLRVALVGRVLGSLGPDLKDSVRKKLSDLLFI